MKTTHEVIMPALGMTQDTGVINAWLKTVGDTVAETDVLMEVETDKTTLEVEAGFAGVIVELRAEPGVDVPVGNVVAMISADKNATPPIAEAAPSTTDATPAVDDPATNTKPPGAASVAAAETPTPPKPARSAARRPATHSPGQILASPKAKFIADQRGIDLHRLVLQGVAQPIHVADLDHYQPGLPTIKTSRLEAEVELEIFDEFAHWAASHSNAAVTPQMIWSLFATGAYRQATGMTRYETIAVEAQSLLEPEHSLHVVDADLDGLLQLPTQNIAVSSGQVVDLLIRDLSDTAMIDYQPEVADTSTLLSIHAGRGKHYRLTLQFSQAQLPLAQAIALLQGIVNRVTQPLTHLL